MLSKSNLTTRSVAALPRKANIYEVADSRLAGLTVRVFPSGKKSWNFRYRADGTQRRMTLGDATLITPARARRKATTLAGEVLKGGDPVEEKRRKRASAEREKVNTLRSFVDNIYEPHILATRRHGRDIISRIKRNFEPWLDVPMATIQWKEIDQWRKERHAGGRTASTTNKDISALNACLNYVVSQEVLGFNPLARLKRDKVDRTPPIKVLADEGEAALRRALRSRDGKLKVARANANRWRSERGYVLYPDFGHFADHLEPMTLLALNTGMRRGEILDLQWDDVAAGQITVRGDISKSGNSRQIPLNDEAKLTLNQLRRSAWGARYVFPGRSGKRMDNFASSWDAIRKSAGLPSLRFHDLRHTFATRLLMRGADIETVSKLLGHSDIVVTSRYLHATDESKRKAVELL